MSELRNKEQLETCRLCLNNTVVKINIFTGDFARMIEILTSIKIRPNDSFPKVSCLKCAKEVKRAFLVRRGIIQSHQLLTTKALRLSQARLSESTALPDGIASASSNLQTLNNLETLKHNSILQLSSDILESRGAEIMSVHSEEAQNNDLLSTTPDVSKKCIEKSTENNGNICKPIPLDPNANLPFQSIFCNKQNVPTQNSCKRKAFVWKTLNKSDQVNIVKWIQKKRNNATAKLSGSLHAQPKKREPLKMFCTLCQMQFINKIHYKNHMNTHKQKVCPICNKQIRSAYFKTHLKLHEDCPAMCEVCGVTCKNPVRLKMHTMYYHQANVSVCEDCGRSFKTKTKLFYHQRKDHIKERNYKCETCGKCFFLKLYLTKHISMKHMKMRPDICEYCGRGFSGKHALRTHIRQHTNEAPFHCEFCGKGFRQRVSLRGHLKTFHHVEEENTVFCDKCKKGFASSMALNVHARLHSEMKCSWCTDTFAEVAYLEQHISAVHPNENYPGGDAQFDGMNLFAVSC